MIHALPMSRTGAPERPAFGSARIKALTSPRLRSLSWFSYLGASCWVEVRIPASRRRSTFVTRPLFTAFVGVRFFAAFLAVRFLVTLRFGDMVPSLLVGNRGRDQLCDNVLPG